MVCGTTRSSRHLIWLKFNNPNLFKVLLDHPNLLFKVLLDHPNLLFKVLLGHLLG